MRPEERAKQLKQISLIREITEELKKLTDIKENEYGKEYL